MADLRPDLQIDSPARYRALGHPLRHRLLMALAENPATISQLARSLDVHKGSVAHHLAVLVEAELVRIGAQRQVRGGTERYYERTAERVVTSARNGSGGAEHQAATTALLSAVATELAAAPDDPLLHLRHVRLTRAQAATLRNVLDLALADLSNTAGEDTARYGVLVSMYEQPTRT